METTLKYLETESVDPSYNLAFEEYILCNRTDSDYLMLWQNNNTIVVGINQNTEAEINRTFVEERHIHVVRRTTGGGAVYHDLGNLNYSFITDVESSMDRNTERFTGLICDALHSLDLPAEASGRNDILINGRKVSGTAQRIVKGRILHHGTLLFDSNLSILAGALRADPSKFQSKGVRSVRSRVGNIRPLLCQDMSLTDFWEYLKAFLGQKGMVFDSLTEEEKNAIKERKREQYDIWDWNYGKSPPYNLSRIRRWNGGTLDVRIHVKEGRIQDIHFFGDFLSLRPLEHVISSLRGCPLRKADFWEAIRHLPLQEYFGSLTAEEIVQTVFDEL